MPSVDGTPLDALPGIPQGVVKALKASWVTTAEQMVAATAATGGADVMAGHLGIDASVFRKALAAAENEISSVELARLKSPADTRNFGLGGPPK